jgi:hypothetical protein
MPLPPILTVIRDAPVPIGMGVSLTASNSFFAITWAPARSVSRSTITNSSPQPSAPIAAAKGAALDAIDEGAKRPIASRVA